jgi:hypothetical protein
LPGALPPRGPPKTGGEGPNKGVSKLQLLMCGNDFIRQLKARVERRDDEIARLRREVARLRIVASNGLDADAGFEGELDYELDLERDLDAIEKVGNGPGNFFSATAKTIMAMATTMYVAWPGAGVGTSLCRGAGALFFSSSDLNNADRLMVPAPAPSSVYDNDGDYVWPTGPQTCCR